MIKVGLVGLGGMGSGHFEILRKLEEEGFPVKLVAICDIDPLKLQGFQQRSDLGLTKPKYDLSSYHLYESLADMLEKEQLDYVEICTPTYLHAEQAIMAMRAGVNVLCEKPMALNAADCDRMVAVSQETGKLLMIAQCLRFWPAYQVLKEIVDDGRFGKVVGGYFFRGGSTPFGSYNEWLLKDELAGGALIDQHIHDVDVINWLFGKPEAVSSVGCKLFEGSGYDSVSTNYIYENMAINAQDDWTMNGTYNGPGMLYRVSFEKGSVHFQRGVVTVSPWEGEAYEAELKPGAGYYYEIKYFIQCLMDKKPVSECLPESTADTLRIVDAEIESCNSMGQRVEVK